MNRPDGIRPRRCDVCGMEETETPSGRLEIPHDAEKHRVDGDRDRNERLAAGLPDTLDAFAKRHRPMFGDRDG